MEYYALNSKKYGWIEIEQHLDFENTLKWVFDKLWADIGDRFFVYNDDSDDANEAYEMMELTDYEYDPVLVWVGLNWDTENKSWIRPEVEWYPTDNVYMNLA